MRDAGAAAGKSCRQIVLAQHHETSDPDTGGPYSIKKYTSEKAFDEDGAWHHEKITLLRAALKKREELKQAYAQEGTDINPLLLIQFPNDTSDELSQEEETLRESLEKYLEAYPGAVYLFDNEDEGIRY